MRSAITPAEAHKIAGKAPSDLVNDMLSLYSWVAEAEKGWRERDRGWYIVAFLCTAFAAGWVSGIRDERQHRKERRAR